MVSKIIGKLFWLGGFVAIVVIAVFYFTKDTRAKNEADLTAEQLEKKIAAAKQKTLQDLEKFLDGQESEKKLAGTVGRSEQEGKELARIEKAKRELEGEAIDLEKVLREEADTFKKDEGTLAEGATDLRQEVMWRVVGDWVYFRLSFSPFDPETHKLMKAPDEAVFLCFNDSTGKRVVPVSASARIPMGSLYVRYKDDEPMGWAFSGKLSVAKVDPDSLDHSRVGWIFSHDLHAHLKKLKDMRSSGGTTEAEPVSTN